MKVIRNMIWLLVSSALFLNCSDDDNQAEGAKTGPVDDGGHYTETKVTVNHNGVKTGTTSLRFYADTEGVAYISVSDFLKVMLPQATMTVNRQGDSYTITTSGGMATVDVKGDKMTTSSIVSIFDMKGLAGMDVPCAVTYDGSPYVKPTGRMLLPEVSTVTFDFGKYHIDLHDDGANVFFPYATLADIFSDMNLNTTYYNDGDKELVVNTSLDFDSYNKMDPNRAKRIYGRLEVSDAMAQYRYDELCFVFDYIYGYPGRDNALFKAGMEQCGFDAALDKIASGAEVKKLLKSKCTAEFILGMDGLQQLAFDGGHTNLSQKGKIDKLEDVKARWETAAAAYPAVAALYKDYSKTLDGIIAFGNTMEALRKATYGDRKYIASTDKKTAVIVMNSMMELDYEGWGAYYASAKTAADWETLLKRDSNMVATFLSGVKQARQDGVKNVILDLTQNTGGSSDLAVAILSLMAREGTERQQVCIYSDYVMSKQTSTTHFVVDRNFDGKFDAEDAKVDYSDLNFAVLTSQRSFSCANLMPSMMKDSGYKVMGQRSGGGSCAIQFQFTPDGMMYIVSCYRLRMLNAKRENIDVGVPVDIEVPVEKFYDIDYLSDCLNR